MIGCSGTEVLQHHVCIPLSLVLLHMAVGRRAGLLARRRFGVGLGFESFQGVHSGVICLQVERHGGLKVW